MTINIQYFKVQKFSLHL